MDVRDVCGKVDKGIAKILHENQSYTLMQLEIRKVE